MNKITIAGIGLALGGLGVAGYFGWKYYQERKASGELGALVEPYANDHNGRIVRSYYRRQAALLTEQQRLRRMGVA